VAVCGLGLKGVFDLHLTYDSHFLGTFQGSGLITAGEASDETGPRLDPRYGEQCEMQLTTKHRSSNAQLIDAC
jgi:hypothetical protein